VDALLTLSTYRGYAVTRLAGVFGQAMAEYCMMHILAQVWAASLADTPKVPAHAVTPASMACDGTRVERTGFRFLLHA
jgi:hypothetical protein